MDSLTAKITAEGEEEAKAFKDTAKAEAKALKKEKEEEKKKAKVRGYATLRTTAFFILP